jgi:hypothetical protein
MKRYLLMFGLACGLVISAGHFTTGAKAEDKEKGETKSIEAKLEKASPAKDIDFAGSIGLNTDSVANLGERIDAARAAGNPITLATLAAELTAAEKAGGKKASLTGEALLKEAVDLAKLRNKSGELKQLSALVSDKATSDDLAALVKKAADKEALEKKAVPRGVGGRLYVQNGTEYTVNISINGVVLFHVYPYRDYSWYIGHSASTNTVIGARASNGQWAWQNTVVFGNYGDYTLYLKK